MSNIYITLPVNHLDISVSNVLFIHNRHFLPFSEPISPYKLRYKGFAVDNYSCILCALLLR